jgi:predicted NBD/HSP70 family sugar kinase
MSRLTDLHDLNVSLILQALRSHRKIARFALADLTGLTRTTVSNVTNNLIALGIVAEGEQGEASAQGGRKPVMLELNPQSLGMMGLDLRREKIGGCVVCLDGRMIRHVSVPFPVNSPPHIVWQAIDRVVTELMAGLEVPVMAMGVGAIAPLDLQTGRLIDPSDFTMPNMPLQAALRERYGLPVVIQTGASAAAVGEHFWATQEGTRLRSLAFVIIDHGIGLGMISDDRLWNTNGLGSDVAHTTIDFRGPLCECGRRGCLNVYASGKALMRHCLEKNLVHDAQVDLSALAQRAEAGDEALQAEIIEAGYLLGLGLANIDSLLRPERFVVGSSHEYLSKWYFAGIEQAISELPQYSTNNTHLLERLLLSTHGSDAIAYGAATLQMKAFFEAPLTILNQIASVA